MSLVEKASIREFLFVPRKNRKNRNTNTIPRKTAPAQQETKTGVCFLLLFKLHFMLPPPPLPTRRQHYPTPYPPTRNTHTKQASSQAEIVFGFI